MIQVMCLTCFLPVAVVDTPPPDDDIYSYLPYTFSCVYSISHVVTLAPDD